MQPESLHRQSYNCLVCEPQAARAFAEGVARIEGLALTGAPAMTVVGFAAANPRALNIYAVNDALSARGWHLSALQAPPALHMCFTAAHTGAASVKPLLQARGLARAP